MKETLELRRRGPVDGPQLVYLPGLHGDWTLVGGFRRALPPDVGWVEMTYPRTTTWSLADYADAVESALADAGVMRGWMLGESFGSQVLWAWAARPARRFDAQGLILAGGFVRYPLPTMVTAVRRIFGSLPPASLAMPLRCFALYARWRAGRHPETLVELDEFVKRRTAADHAAASHRLTLIEKADWWPVAAATRVPLYCLTGFWDPIVPWPLVIGRVGRRCPGFRGRRVIYNADHQVLGSASNSAAAQVVAWMKAGPGSGS